MHRALRTKRVFPAAAALILSGAALAGAGAVPAQAQTYPTPGETLYLYLDVPGSNSCGTASGYFLHAHAHNAPVDIQCSPSDLQWWQMVLPEIYPAPNGSSGTAYELELENTGQCLNDDPNNGNLVYLDSCQSGNTNELFWVAEIGASNLVWYRNVAATWDEYVVAGLDGYYYLTDQNCAGGGSPEVGDEILDYPSGCGSYAVWATDT